MSDRNHAYNEIQAGAVVYLTGEGTVVLHDPKQSRRQEPVGIAKRDIEKGEVIVYAPGRETEDVVWFPLA